MAEYLTQSRPYAEAIFEIAEQDNSVDSWIKDLGLISTSFQDNLIQALIDTPDISQREKAEKFVSIFEGEVSANKITIASSGSVKGDLSYKRVAIDDGAILDVKFHKI